ncbi:cupin domain-containing protein [Geothrix paludis]|uniref:cupin domain-containing protein n=1 Tax=Geothrix paludis TaxID=2922722 RepID=UPI001FAC48EA|nr:cupin domain-containing protein [Geothrix paludis]
MHPVSIQNADHYVWGDHCDGWHLLQGDDLHVIQERVPPGKAEKRHLHSTAKQFFFILAGRAVMELNGVDHPLSTGEGIHIPRGMPHQFKNPFGDPVEFLVISHPTTRGDRTDLA